MGVTSSSWPACHPAMTSNSSASGSKEAPGTLISSASRAPSPQHRRQDAGLDVDPRYRRQIPGPKVVVAIGSCPATGNVFDGSPMIEGPVDRIIPVDVYIPGCPPRPHSIMDGIAQAIEILATRKEDHR